VTGVTACFFFFFSLLFICRGPLGWDEVGGCPLGWGGWVPSGVGLVDAFWVQSGSPNTVAAGPEPGGRQALLIPRKPGCLFVTTHRRH